MATARTSSRKRQDRKRAPARVAARTWTEHNSHGLHVLRVPAFAKLPWLVHGFSTRLGGESLLEGQRVLNLGFTDWDASSNVLENRRRFQATLGAGDSALVTHKQVHSDIVHVIDSTPAHAAQGLAALAGDASVTDRPGLLLAVQTADCVPVLLVDPKRRVVAAVHAGWRGTVQRIAAKAVGKMHMQHGCKPSDLLAALGPSIGGCCYEVGREVAAAFISQFSMAAEWFDELRTEDEPNPLQWLNMAPPGHQPPPKKVLLDLRKANRSQLLEAGLRPKNIFVSDLCTACRLDLFFSYRKEGPLSGRLMSVIGLRP